MNCRFATPDDVPLLASFNRELIRDEGHRNSMNLVELGERMAAWLEGDYRAVILELDSLAVGYALFRRDPDYVYLRQLFVVSIHRRQGIGKAAIEWLWAHAWADARVLRIEVLVGNATARAFWKSVGFEEYCVTMEARSPRGTLS